MSKNITDYEAIEKTMLHPTEVPEELEDRVINPWYEWTKLIEKGAKKKVQSEVVWETLTPRQLKFIELYTGDLLGNWVQAYLEVYDIDTSKPWWYKTACVCASQLLSNTKVYTKINEMLEDAGLNDNFVDKQMLFLISQQADFTAKAKMIAEYNKIKQRVTKKIDVNVNTLSEEHKKILDDVL